VGVSGVGGGVGGLGGAGGGSLWGLDPDPGGGEDWAGLVPATPLLPSLNPTLIAVLKFFVVSGAGGVLLMIV
jgi:hypothetical protein